MNPRTIKTPEEQALKRASKALVRAAGGIEASAEFCRVGKSLLSDYGRPEGECYMPIDVVADLEAITRDTAGWPLVTRTLAARAGCALVALPEAEPIEGDWLGIVGQLSAESNDITTRVCDAARDGKVCAADVRQLGLTKECDDAIALLVNLRALFERIEALTPHRGT